MDNIILDIETAGLLDTVSKVHCIVMKSRSFGMEVATTEEQIEKAISFGDENTKLAIQQREQFRILKNRKI